MVLAAADLQGALMGRVKHTIARGVAVAAALLCLGLPALAQGTFNDTLAAKQQQRPGAPPQRLLVEAKEIVYNDDKNTVTASGDVELNYGGRTLQADRVVYNRATGRVVAEGNTRLTDATGTVTTGSRFELTDDFRSGFIDTLRVEQTTKDRSGPVKTRFSAPRAERIEGETTIFENGTYTPCEPCRENPERPPLWQVKAARIIHNNSERTIYYEDASFEFLGVPVAYIPYFWSPDPSVRRQTGFLAPHYIASSSLGTGASLPFFWAMAPDYDLTVQPTFYSRQGVLAQAEFRQRMLNGAYNIRAAGIIQQDKSAYLPAPFGPGEKDARGSLETAGRFYINDRWRYGWDIALLSDKWFLQNYKIKSESVATNYISLESTSTVYLQGQGDRSFFDLRGYYFQGLSYADWQKQLPLVAPVLDYNKRVNGPAPLGGEVSVDFNTYYLTREAAQFQASSLLNRAFPFGLPYESCAVFRKDVCLVRALPGDFARTSVNVSWRRSFVDDAGQVWTPFAYFRADGFYSNPNTTGFQNSQIGNFYNTQQDFVGRATPAVGLEYRYPFVADAGRYGTHTLTPIGQVVARPNESRVGRVPNEDAHSLVFDDTTLFDWDKFSGNDRAEGGVRANVGLRYDLTTPSGWTANALVGQSYQIAGQNSYSVGDLLNTGLNSGLESRASDYVGRVQVNPSDNYGVIVRGRFDHKDLSVNSFEAQAFANLKPWIPFTGTLTYARYDAQPELGVLHRREGLAPGASFALTPNWSVSGSVLFDLARYLDARDTYTTNYLNALATGGQAAADRIVYNRTSAYAVASTGLSVGYRDECTTFSLNYTMSPRLGATGQRESDQTVLVRLELRTLGQTALSQNLNGAATADGIGTR
jgi:LPS-assembly protein